VRLDYKLLGVVSLPCSKISANILEGIEVFFITPTFLFGLCEKQKKYKSFSVLYSKDKAIERKNNPQTGWNKLQEIN
jgi:hypothetical protein